MGIDYEIPKIDFFVPKNKMVLPLDILTRIFLFLTKEQVRQVQLINREFNQAMLQTPFFQRDYLDPGPRTQAFLDWLHFPKIIQVGICQYNLTKYLETRPDLITSTFVVACRLGNHKLLDYILRVHDNKLQISEITAGIKLTCDPYIKKRLESLTNLQCSECSETIQEASKNGHIQVVERLLQDPRVDPSAGNNYAIRMASHRDHIHVVERLLQDPRVDPSAGDNQAYCHANPEIANLLTKDIRVQICKADYHISKWI